MCACPCVQAIMRVELLYGMAGLLGSLASGHLFLVKTVVWAEGTVLLVLSILLELLGFLHSVFLLKVRTCCCCCGGHCSKPEAR